MTSGRADKLNFDLDERVLRLGLTGVYFTMSDLRNALDDAEFNAYRAQTLQDLVGEAEGLDLKQDPVLAGFRDLHTAVGRSNRDNIASPENLLRLLARNGSLGSISLLVDVYNLVSLKTRLALGAHDLALVEGDIHLTLTDGAERFLPLGAEEPKPVRPGEYAYIDDAHEVICRMEVRQVEKTKVSLETTECFYIVQGNAATDSAYVWAAAHELINLTKRYCGGQERILYGP